MRALVASLRFVLCAMMVLLVLSSPLSAQQRNNDGSVNPTASSVNEEQLFRDSQRIQGRITLPDTKEGVLIQPAGRDWRQFHEVTLRWIAAIVILGTLIGLVAFYLWRGMVRLQTGPSGRTIVRFNAFERFVHWMTATCFIILAITGLNVTFGKLLLLPLMSPGAFTTWSQAAKYAHNFLSFPFTIGVIVIFLMWIAGNIPSRVDVEWFRQGGGILDPKKHPPAHRFNGGQKMMYWIVVLGGAAMAISGYLLMFPFWGGMSIAAMQNAGIVHSIVAVLFIAAILGHIYIGTIGMEGAFHGMGSGEVDINWAREHHPLWVEDEMRRPGERDAVPRGTPAE